MFKRRFRVSPVVIMVLLIWSIIVVPAQATTNAHPLLFDNDLKPITIGPDHSVVVSGDGSVWQWGEKLLLGLQPGTVGQDIYQETPIEVPGLQNVQSVFSGFPDGNFALKTMEPYGLGALTLEVHWELVQLMILLLPSHSK